VTYPGLLARELTRDTSNYGRVVEQSPGVTADGRSVVSVQSAAQANIWVLSPSDAAGAHQVTRSVRGVEGETGLDWTPDGRLVFTSLTSGNWEIWSMNVDGSDRRQLTTDRRTPRWPLVSPDGRVIAYHTGEGVWLMDADGGRQRWLTPWGTEDPPRIVAFFTADSKWVVVRRLQPGLAALWRVAIENSQNGPLIAHDPQADHGRVVPPDFVPMRVSPDGTWAAGIAGKTFMDGWVLVRMDGSAPWREIRAFRGKGVRVVQWARDSRSLTYSDGQNLWAQPIDDGPARPLTAFTGEETISSFAWSRDGRRLAVSRHKETSDAVMITSEEKK
jgi:Tol biopolymer transport system component